MDHYLYILAAFGILLVVVFLWMAVYYWSNPRVEDPDGSARITGKCGDTMEILLKFEGDRVKDTSHWTDGCVYSLNCVYAAAKLARNRTPDEILDIDSDLIEEQVGGLPTDHHHCANLAWETLQAALDDYMRNSRRNRKDH